MHTENWEKNEKETPTHTYSDSRIPLQACICVNTEPNKEWGARKMVAKH